MISKLASNFCLETDPDCPSTTNAKIFKIDQKKYSDLRNGKASRRYLISL
jgi:hypothetical protein